MALLLGVLGAADARDPLHRPVELPVQLEPPARPLRVAWSADLGGLPIEPGQVAVLERFRGVVEAAGWDVEEAEPDLRGADECFRTLRAWQIATGPAVLVAPVTQLAPFPVEWEYPTSVAGLPMNSYIEWMSACCRITVLGTPTLSVPAGFDAAGLPVGAQLIGRHGGDVELLRAAAVLEAATDHRHRRPPVVEAAP